MLRGSIIIKATKNYGNVTIYPVCQSAQMLARIAGTKTLTPATITLLLDANLAVTQEFPNGDVLAIESLSDIAA